MSFIEDLSPQARNVPESSIVAVVNHARLRQDVIPLWVGEGDLPTPGFICDAAVKSLRDGETFYTWQRGIPHLRQALADYYQRHFGGTHDPETFFVTGSGMQAIKLTIEALCAAGDEVVYLSPAWPNISAALDIAGVRSVPVTFDYADRGWTFDPARLAAAIGPKTRALFINTPSNPTGWTASTEELRTILDLARKAGTWIIADEIYARYYYAGHRAPSFLDIMEADDRILFVNTFSKNWSMTGWRAGWIKAPAELGQTFENLIQYSTSGVPQFIQRGAAAALNDGDDYVEEQKLRAARARDVLCDALMATNRVRLLKPDGAFYCFFAIDGLEDTGSAVYRIVDNADVGLSPGIGFGPGGEAFLRACFLRRLDHVEEAANRLARFVSSL
ncbi:MAG: pyridoxal phosphate-dependent aminotransferase [Hyphomicrobiales bacterium]|nr:pyridoxal phosphate-dependent aminotransferase [Hyphomicrobiales bacterium]MCP4997642.1 pyridoxal phosphate-dependent aminotransferase [Hyphomicrobiales bacterium]